jgi:hypothetical protein|tara:strand:+ start:811 stop:1485 length:675 start_codon:yes stop_codon:yes gene_type:complete
MDDVITQINKSKKDEIDVEDLIEKNKKNSEFTNVSIFDKTLKEIDQIINSLELKSEVEKDQLKKLSVSQIKSTISKTHLEKKELVKREENLIKDNDLKKKIKDSEKDIHNSNEPISPFGEFKDESINESEEHKIDKNLLSIEELDYFKKNDEKIKKSSFGFFGYQILIISVFFTFYGTLNVSKNLIISKYPKTESYIQNFFETIEIINVAILGFVDFIKSIILN